MSKGGHVVVITSTKGRFLESQFRAHTCGRDTALSLDRSFFLIHAGHDAITVGGFDRLLHDAFTIGRHATFAGFG